MQRPTVLDLFSGAGGISHGLEQAGLTIVAGVDFDADAVRTFKENHPGARSFQADLAKTSPADLARIIGVSPGSIDCVVGGPPCQGFSRNRAFRHQDGAFIDDPRNYLYWHFFEFVQHLQPKVVLMENVPEILIKKNGAFKNAVFERFGELGYNVEAKVLNASDYGVPQHRRRAFFLAGKEGQRIAFPEPTTRPGPRAGRRTPKSCEYIRSSGPNNEGLPLFDVLPEGPSVWDAIGDLYGTYAESLYTFSEYACGPVTAYQRERRDKNRRVSNHFPWPLTERQLKRIRLLKEGQGQAHLPKELQTSQGYGSAYRRLHADAQALTITTWMFHPGSGMFTHPFEDRVITIREAARLQSFQDRFTFVGRYHSQCRQVGNAVAPLVARSLGGSIMKAFGHSITPALPELSPAD